MASLRPDITLETEGGRKKATSFWKINSRHVALLGVILAIVLVACSNTIANDTSQPASSNPAPDVAITLYQGQEAIGSETLNLSDLRGKPVVLNFWAGLCPPCRAEMPDLQEFYEEFNDRVVLLGLDVGQFTGLGNQEDAQALLEELGVTYPAGFTTDGSVISRHKVLGMPTTVFIDANGEIFRNWTGALNTERMTEITNEMLAQ
ncbi:MAG: TlpA family protein disulfide reductase [Dehalococcoidia bacterium]